MDFITNMQLFTSQDVNWWTGFMWIIVMFLLAVLNHSDGTHSLQRIHWWASDIMLHFYKSVQMKKLIYMLDGLKRSKSSANFHLCMKRCFDIYHVCLMWPNHGQHIWPSPRGNSHPGPVLALQVLVSYQAARDTQNDQCWQVSHHYALLSLSPLSSCDRPHVVTV